MNYETLGVHVGFMKVIYRDEDNELVEGDLNVGTLITSKILDDFIKPTIQSFKKNLDEKKYPKPE